jgi:hypothetical protein
MRKKEVSIITSHFADFAFQRHMLRLIDLLRHAATKVKLA